MDLTTIMLESTGVFSLACNMWRLCPTTNKTYIKFRKFFTTKNKERLRKTITTSTISYHSANAKANSTFFGSLVQPTGLTITQSIILLLIIRLSTPLTSCPVGLPSMLLLVFLIPPAILVRVC